MSIKVGVIGAAGRMGVETCRAIFEDPKLDLCSAIAPSSVGRKVSDFVDIESDLIFSDNPQDLVDTECSVAVDFTHLDVSRKNLDFLSKKGIHAVIGTSGYSETDFDDLRSKFTSSNCLIVPSFAISAVLLMKFSQMASPYFETAEIIEYHHYGKVDSPSGLSVATAEAMAAANTDWAPDPTQSENLPGARGAKGAGGIPIHAVRMKGMIAGEEVLFGTQGQTMMIRHESYDRTSFMPGVVLAVKKIADYPGLTVGLQHLLDL